MFLTPPALQRLMGKGLVQASLSGNADGIRAALKAGDILEKYDGRALRSAVAHGHLEAARALFDAGARTDTRVTVEPSGMVPGALSKDRLGGATLLHLCASAPHLDRMAALLLQRGADASACTTTTKNTPLHLAATYGCADVARALLAGGAPSNVRNAEGHAPLHLAMIHKHAACAVALLQGSTDVNFKTARSNTALHIVCETEFSNAFDRALATLLLQHGANPELRNNDNHTPLECVTRLGPHRAAFQQLVATTPRRSASAARAPAATQAQLQQAATAGAAATAATAAAEAARVSVSQAEAAKAKAEADTAKGNAEAAKAKAEAELMHIRLQVERAKAAASTNLAPSRRQRRPRGDRPPHARCSVGHWKQRVRQSARRAGQCGVGRARGAQRAEQPAGRNVPPAFGCEQGGHRGGAALIPR